MISDFNASWLPPPLLLSKVWPLHFENVRQVSFKEAHHRRHCCSISSCINLLLFQTISCDFRLTKLPAYHYRCHCCCLLSSLTSISSFSFFNLKKISSDFGFSKCDILQNEGPHFPYHFHTKLIYGIYKVYGIFIGPRCPWSDLCVRMSVTD